MNTPQWDDYDFEALNAAFHAGLKKDIAWAKAFRRSFMSDPSIQAGLRMVWEVVRERKEKKQRVAQKIWELKSSVSYDAINALLWAQSNAFIDKQDELEFSERNFVAIFESMLDRNFEITARVLDMFWTGIDWIRGARELAAGSIEDQDPLAQALARHWIDDPDKFLSQTWEWAGITTQYDAMIRNSST